MQPIEGCLVYLNTTTMPKSATFICSENLATLLRTKVSSDLGDAKRVRLPNLEEGLVAYVSYDDPSLLGSSFETKVVETFQEIRKKLARNAAIIKI